MCGFVTLFCPSGQKVPAAVLRRMTNRLAHRGPDDTGFAAIDPHRPVVRLWGRDLPDDLDLSGVLFGHCRLSILDLTPAARQPMVSDNGSSVLAFNGEIYNFLELRNTLSAAGVTLRGTGDTERRCRAGVSGRCSPSPVRTPAALMSSANPTGMIATSASGGAHQTVQADPH